jgi:hypothetical protein
MGGRLQAFVSPAGARAEFSQRESFHHAEGVTFKIRPFWLGAS